MSFKEALCKQVDEIWVLAKELGAVKSNDPAEYETLVKLSAKLIEEKARKLHTQLKF